MDKESELQHYGYDGIGRLKVFIYGLLGGLAQIILLVPAMWMAPNPENPGLGIIIYFLLVFVAGLIFGIYLIYQRCKNIGINPWIGLVLCFLPIINLFWTIGLYILPAGFWDDKRLDTAAKVWLILIIFFFIITTAGIGLLVPALADAVNKEKARLLENPGQQSEQTMGTPFEDQLLEQSYGLDTKCPDYTSTQKSFEKILNALKSQNPENSKLVLTEIAKKQGELNPLIIGMAANLMIQRGQTEKALFWLYAGELRTLSDLNLYKEREVAGTFLQEYLGGDFNGGRITALTPEARREIELFIESNRENAKEQLKRALAWDKRTPKDYNRLWLGTEGSLPPSQWAAQDQKTRTKFGQAELASIGVGPVDSVFKPR
jgi:hypothetical protein